MKRVLTPEAAAYLGGLSPLTGPRRSTPPSRRKAIAYRLRRAIRETVAELKREAPVPVGLGIAGAVGGFLYLVFC